jgi:hypothetical protein
MLLLLDFALLEHPSDCLLDAYNAGFGDREQGMISGFH